MYFLFLKVFVIIQFILVLIKKENEETVTFLISDMLFKVSIGLFLILFFWFNHVDLEVYDKLIIAFGGTLLIFDAVYTNLPKVLKLLFNINFNPSLIFTKAEPKK